MQNFQALEESSKLLYVLSLCVYQVHISAQKEFTDNEMHWMCWMRRERYLQNDRTQKVCGKYSLCNHSIF